MARSIWSGALRINSLLQAQVSISKGSESYRGKEDLKEVCECCQLPFTRETICDAGHRRLTDAMRKAKDTDNTTEAVKGVEIDTDEYAVLDPTQLDAIANAGTSDTIALEAVIDAADAPMERTYGLYYIQPDKNVKGAEAVLAVFFAARRTRHVFSASMRSQTPKSMWRSSYSRGCPVSSTSSPQRTRRSPSARKRSRRPVTASRSPSASPTANPRSFQT